MLELMEDWREVVVLLLRLAPLFSWMITVTMSPTRWAFLSANMEAGEASSFHNESAPSVVNCNINRSNPRWAASQRDKYEVFILYFSIKFTVGFWVEHAHGLSQRPVFQRFNFERNS